MFFIVGSLISGSFFAIHISVWNIRKGYSYMKRNKIFILLLSFSILASGLLGCAKRKDTDSGDPTDSAQMTQSTERTDPAVEADDFSITVVDMTGREITLDEPA